VNKNASTTLETHGKKSMKFFVPQDFDAGASLPSQIFHSPLGGLNNLMKGVGSLNEKLYVNDILS
jgi:hypothetical protein